MSSVSSLPIYLRYLCKTIMRAYARRLRLLPADRLRTPSFHRSLLSSPPSTTCDSTTMRNRSALVSWRYGCWTRLSFCGQGKLFAFFVGVVTIVALASNDPVMRNL
jgi:hypothetical protein